MSRAFSSVANDRIDCGTVQRVYAPVVSCWARHHRNPGDDDIAYALLAYGEGDVVAFSLRIGDGISHPHVVEARARTDGETGSSLARTIATLTEDQTYHIAFIADPNAGTLKVYVDGSEASLVPGTGTLDGRCIRPTGVMRIGVQHNGEIEDVAIWDNYPGFGADKITAADIAALAAKTIRPIDLPKRLVAYHPLEGAESPEPDHAGDHHDGTLHGTAAGSFPVFTDPYVNPLSEPKLLVRIDATNQPTNTDRAWSDISERVLGVSWRRSGRSPEQARSEPPSVSLTASNADGLFNPRNEDSAFYPNLKTTRWLQISLVWGHWVYRQWVGVVETIPQQDDLGFNPRVTLTGSGLSKLLANGDLAGLALEAGGPGQQAAAILEHVGVPVGTIAEGVSSVPAKTFPDDDQTSPADYLGRLEDGELGFMFEEAWGRVSFLDRTYRQVMSAEVVATLGRDEEHLRYQGGELTDDDTLISNVVIVRASGSDVAQTSSSATSIAEHFARKRPLQEILSEDDADALAVANWFIRRYAEPPPRMDAVTVKPQRNPERDWPVVLAARNGDQFAFEADGDTRYLALERVSGSWTPAQKIQFNWELSAAERPWLLGVTGFSELGVSTVLGAK